MAGYFGKEAIIYERIKVNKNKLILGGLVAYTDCFLGICHSE